MSEAAAKIGLLTNLTTVQLSDTLSMEAVATLQDANPNAKFKYSFTLFGKQLTTSDTSVEYKNEALGNSAEAEIRKALAILDECDRFVLDDCAIDYNILADIRDDFPEGPNLVWRVYFGEGNRYTTLTDDDLIRAVANVTDETSYNLRYCNKVKYIDVGHNENPFFRITAHLGQLLLFLRQRTVTVKMPWLFGNTNLCHPKSQVVGKFVCRLSVISACAMLMMMATVCATKIKNPL